MANKALFILLYFIFITVCGAQGQSSIDIAETIDYPIGNYVEHFYDASRELDFAAARTKIFSPSKKSMLNFGYNTGADWLRLQVHNSSDQEIERKLRINKPLIDSLQLFYQKGDQIMTDVTGCFVSKERQFKNSKSNYFTIHVPAGETVTYYLRVASMHSKQLAIYINDDYQFIYYEQGVTIVIGFYFGALLIITLFMLFLGISIKDPVYLFYALSNFGALIATLTLKGFFTGYVFPGDPELSLLFVPMFIISFAIFSSFFCLKMVDLKLYNKPVYYLFILLVIFEFGAVVVPYTLTKLGFVVTYQPLAIGTLLFTVMACVSGVIAIKNGNKNAKHYLMAWIVGLVGAFLYVLLLIGYLPLNFLTENLYMLGSVIETLLLSFALADRYKSVQLERNKLEENLRYREGDLALVISDNKMRHQFRQKLLEDVEEVNKADNNDLRGRLNSLITNLKMQLETEGKLNYFQNNIDNINAEFESKLKTLHPELTQSELELCYLIKLKLSTKEMANFRKTSEGAIKVARHRIRKKIGQDFEVIVSDL